MAFSEGDPSRNPSSHPVFSYADHVAERWQDVILLVGRWAVGWIYMQSGLRKLQDLEAFAKSMPGRQGLPEFMAYIAAPVEFIGGAAILLGLATRYAALVMLLFTIVASLSSHAWWTYPAAQQMQQFTQFWKNTTMKGALILLFVTAAGRYSVDALLRRRAT